MTFRPSVLLALLASTFFQGQLRAQMPTETRFSDVIQFGTLEVKDTLGGSSTTTVPLGEVVGPGTSGPFGGVSFSKFCAGTFLTGDAACAFVMPSRVSLGTDYNVKVGGGVGLTIDTTQASVQSATVGLIKVRFDLSASGPGLQLPPGSIAQLLLDITSPVLSGPRDYVVHVRVPGLPEETFPPPQGYPVGFPGHWQKNLGFYSVSSAPIPIEMDISSAGVVPPGHTDAIQVQAFLVYRGWVGPEAPYGTDSTFIVTPPGPTYCVQPPGPSAPPFPPILSLVKSTSSQLTLSALGSGVTVIGIGAKALPGPFPLLGFGAPPLYGCGLAVETPLLGVYGPYAQIPLPPLPGPLILVAQAIDFQLVPPSTPPFHEGFSPPQFILINQ